MNVISHYAPSSSLVVDRVTDTSSGSSMNDYRRGVPVQFYSEAPKATSCGPNL
jgi:hypothetical protein